ncbi:nucleotidyltransferase domain-containing protein [Cyanobacteria bacterium FACHB-63]|nr:nucleotidyltransferase domain-containing protein [Cyanobacteria bacterium FACHB-63]
MQTGLGIEELLSDKRSQILEIAARHGASDVRVFGSVARREATATSDIDFLVNYDLEKISPWFPGGLEVDLEKLLQRKVDVAAVLPLKERIRETVLSGAVPL